MSFLNLSVAESIDVGPAAGDRSTSSPRCTPAIPRPTTRSDFALKKQAKYIVLVPCCQAEVAAVLRKNKGKALAQDALTEIWRHPLHTREFGSQVTNVLRCLQLEAHGYQVTVTELVGWEHSMKNELIIASYKDLPRSGRPSGCSEVLADAGPGGDGRALLTRSGVSTTDCQPKIAENMSEQHWIDLRSDTVTQPTAGDARGDGRAPGRRRRVRRRPDRQPPAGRRVAELLGYEAGAVRAHRHAEQPDRADDAIAAAATNTWSARKRTPTSTRAAARRCWAASSRSRSPTSRTARSALERHRGRDQARRPALRAHPAAGAGEHDRRPRAAAGLRARPRRAARMRRASPRTWTARASVQRRRGKPASPLRDAAARLRHRVGLPVEGPRRAGRLGAAAARRRSSSRRGAGARCWAAACARPASSRRPALYALEHNVERLADDHANAELSRAAWRAIDG